MTVELFTAENVRFDEKGLVPVIVQDAVSKVVLTLAYMNKESLQRSLETKETWFWSRSRQELWHKGATSGNTQRIVSIQADCDGDALVVQVVPNGPACHTGAYSCFAGELLAGGRSGKQARAVRKLLQPIRARQSTALRFWANWKH